MGFSRQWSVARMWVGGRDGTRIEKCPRVEFKPGSLLALELVRGGSAVPRLPVWPTHVALCFCSAGQSLLSLFKSRTLFFFFVSPSFPRLRESPAQVLYLATVSLTDRKTLALEGAISISISGSRLITMLRNRITSLIRRSLHLSTFVPKGAHFLVLKSEYVCHSQKFHLQCSSTAMEAINSHRMHVDYLYGGFAR